MSAYTIGSRFGAAPGGYGGGPTPPIPGPTGYLAPPLNAPYPGAELTGSAAGVGGLANRHPGAAGHPYHTSTPSRSGSSAAAPLAAIGNGTPQLGLLPPPHAFQFAQIPGGAAAAATPQQQQSAAAAASYPVGAAAAVGQLPPGGNSDAMRDYVASLRAQVASLKGEVDANGRRVSGSAPPAPPVHLAGPPSAGIPPAGAAQIKTLLQQQQLQVNAMPAPTVSAAATPAAGSLAGGGAYAPASTTAASSRIAPSSAIPPRPASAAPAAASSSTRPATAGPAPAASTRSNAPASAAGARSPGAGATTTGRSSSVGRKAGGKVTMSQRVVALREELKEKEEAAEHMTAELTQCRESLGTTSHELDVTKQILASTDANLRELTAKHSEMSAEFQETSRQLESSNAHGETLEAQVSVYRRAKELEHDQDRLFAYFLKHCLCAGCIPAAEKTGAISHVPEKVCEGRATTEMGLLASAEENPMHCADKNSNPIKLGDGSLRVPHEIAVLVNKNFEEVSNRVDAQRSQIQSLTEQLRGRDAEIASLNNSCKAMQAALDLLREQHRRNENDLVLERAEKASAEVRRDDAVRMVHLLKAALREALQENDRIATELDAQLTRIQVIDANEAMHKNRHDDAKATIEVRTREIHQLRAVIDTMTSNHNSVETENRQLRAAANTLQEQIGAMKRRFDSLNADVSRRLQEQALRVTQIEEHTMKLATTAVQAQMAEQEASKAAQRLIEQMRTASNETQQVTATAVNEMHAVPAVYLPQPAYTVQPQSVPTSIDEEDGNDENGGGGGAGDNGNSSVGRGRSPARGEQMPRHGPLSPAGRLGTALAESASFGSAPHQNNNTVKQQQRQSPDRARGELAAQVAAENAADERKMKELLTPFRMPGSVAPTERVLDPAEQLVLQIRATLAEDDAAKRSLEQAMSHASETIGTA